jgi:hypothetical protein
MADRADALVSTKLATSAVSLLCALAIVVAAGTIAWAKGGGFTVLDILVAPIVLIFYAGPGVLVMGMASRSRSWLPLAIPLVLCVAVALLIEVMGLTPWHYGRWQADPNDAGTRLFIAMLFLLWPSTLAGGLAWLLLNRAVLR